MKTRQIKNSNNQSLDSVHPASRIPHPTSRTPHPASRTPHPASFLIILLAFLLCSSAALAGMSPSFVVYGLVNNEHGIPMGDGDGGLQVVVDGEVLKEQPVMDVNSDGVNYRLAIPVENGLPLSDDSNQPSTGDSYVIRHIADGSTNTVSSTETLVVGDPAEHQYIDLTLGDVDTAGVPAAWRQLIVDRSGTYTNADQVDMSADFDGDGASNMEEYIAGTSPTWATDLFQIETIDGDVDGLFEMSWWSVAGKSYSVHSSTADIAEDGALDWQTAAYYETPGSSSPSTDSIIGNGDIMSVYLIRTNSIRLFNLNVE